MLKNLIGLVMTSLFTAAIAYAADQGNKIVVYDGIATSVAASAVASTDLWVSMSDLKRATRFVVKPQGVCRDELCFPLPKGKRADFVAKRGAVIWFNLSAFARLAKQPSAHDEKNGVWYFGPWSQAHEGYLETLAAPDFRLADSTGKQRSLSEFRGKKVLLVTWASW